MHSLLKAVTAVLMGCVLTGAASSPVGSVKTIEGSVTILRDNVAITATLGQQIFCRDTVKTDKNSRVGIVLRDDTTLSLGGQSTLKLKDYVFQPKDKEFSLIVKMIKGTFVYLSGVMGKLAPDAIRLETPDSTIGIRGTRLLIQVSNP